MSPSYTDYLKIVLTWKYFIVCLLFVVIVTMEIQLLRINQFLLKIAHVKYNFLDNFTHQISTWEIRWLPMIESLFRFPLAVVVGYYTPIVLDGMVKHFFPISILPYLKLDFMRTDSLSITILFGVLFLVALFVTEADNATPLIRRILETIRTNMKDMISIGISEANSEQVLKKVDVIVGQFYKMLGLEEKVTLAEKLDEYYEKLILHDSIYPRLRKLYYSKGAGFIVAFLLGTHSNISIFVAVLPAYLIAFFIRKMTLRRICDLYMLYNDFAKDIIKNSSGEKSKLLNMIPD